MAKKRDPLKGTLLGRLALVMARPVNRDVLRVVAPSDPRRKKGPDAKAAGKALVQRSGRQQKLLVPRKQLMKRDGSIVQATLDDTAGLDVAFKPTPPRRHT